LVINKSFCILIQKANIDKQKMNTAYIWMGAGKPKEPSGTELTNK